MKAVYKAASPYQEDKMNLPVGDVEAAIPFYEQTMGFEVVSKQDSPVKSVILGRDDIQIGLAENGGDSSQDGCFFVVDRVATAYLEIYGAPDIEGKISLKEVGGISYLAFFVIAPDGLCYMIAEPQS